jgi:diadenosine tetraphosphate (Ap4A) HIT family hydrolase
MLWWRIGEGSMAELPCVFCDIIRGQAPASVVCADERAMAFVDIRPVNLGHLLVVPRVHASQLAELDPVVGSHLFRVGMLLAGALRRSGVRCEGVNLYLADGAAAGQEISHVHLHVVPRFRGDGFGLRRGPENFQRPERAVLEEVAADVRAALEVVTHGEC